MPTLHPYLNFNGTCREAFAFYKEVFQTDYFGMMTFGEMPPPEPAEHPSNQMLDANFANQILHVALPIGPHTMLMGSDWPPHIGPMVQGNAYSVTVSVDSQAEADRLFQALGQGGKVNMPIGDTFWGAYFGMCSDRFGVQWMISFDKDTQRIDAHQALSAAK